jgi:uncharacterized membrane protein YoaK (UPF0700 family)
MEHSAFIIGLGFVAGFIDVFGFSRLSGLLPAHVTGNLIFLALTVARGHTDVLIYILALPIFCAGVVLSAWIIGTIAERGFEPLLPALLLEAGLLFAAMLGSLALPPSHSANSLTSIGVGIPIVLAMSMQNTLMRLVLNNMPPTTVMTGNITQVLGDFTAYFSHFSSIRHTQREKKILERQAERMLFTFLSFLAGALLSAFASGHFRGGALVLPILALLVLVPYGRKPKPPISPAA